MAGIIQLRRDTAANWAATNPRLEVGEKGLETDTGREKNGDGVRLWNSLPYVDSVAAGGLAAHLADTVDAHAASAIGFTPTSTISATTVQAAIVEVDAEHVNTPAAAPATVGDILTKSGTTGNGDTAWTTRAAMAADPAFSSRYAATRQHVTNASGDEPGPMVVFSFDDGYTTAVDYFNLLNSKGVKGTLFLTQNWVDRAGTNPTWGNDTYITTAQVQAIANAGHEIGGHTVNHISVTQTIADFGVSGLHSQTQQVKNYIESTYGVPCRTFAYPAGISSKRAREVIARSHVFARGTKGMVATDCPDPFDIPAIDIQALSLGAVTAFIDTAIAERSLCVFLVHGGLTAPQLSMIGSAIDYCTANGVPMDTFFNAVSQRMVYRGSAASAIDSSGHAFFSRVRAHRFEVSRNDTTGGSAYFDIDETESTPFFDSTQATTWEFRRGVRMRGSFSVGKRTRLPDGATTNGSTTVTSAAAGFDSYDIGITISGTGIPAGSTIVSINSATSVVISQAATATATGVVLTLGRPAPPAAEFNGTVNLRGSVILDDTTAPNLEFFTAGVKVGDISGSTWRRTGTGGAMTIDSGSGGSNIDLRGFRIRTLDAAGNRRIALATATPTDASINPGEVVLWLDPTNGATRLMVRAKSTDGTVVNGNLVLA